MGIAERLAGGRTSAPRQSQPAPPENNLDQVMAELHTQVVDQLDIVAVRQLDAGSLNARIGSIVDQLLAQRQLCLGERQRDRVVRSIIDEIVGLGPLEPLLADPTISDILVNTASTVYVERNGVLENTRARFRDNAHLLNIINRIVARVGRRIDESSPMVDARLPDGSRVNAIIPPLAIDGPLLSIRRFGTGPLRPEDLVRTGTMTEHMLQFLRCAVRAKCNILVSGGTGAGKTTLLNALSGFIPPGERIITIEDAAELHLQQTHTARLETRPPNIEGKGEVTIRDLVRNALRMRPDRIVVGEVRSAEVLDMLQAMNTGHEGSMTTVHANSAPDAITRVMGMLAMSGTNISEPMMRQTIARSLHLVVHVTRGSDGRRRVDTIAEIAGIQDERIGLNPVFSFARAGTEGEFRSSGNSRLLRRFQAAGVTLHPAVVGSAGVGRRGR